MSPKKAPAAASSPAAAEAAPPAAARTLVVRYRKLDELVPYARNARTHSDAQVAEIGASILEYGWTNPVLVDELGGMIAGHGRVLAARWLLEHHPKGLAKKGIVVDPLPTIELAGLSEAQKAAYVLADNKIALNAGWNTDMVAAELMRIQELGMPLPLTGFSAAEAQNIISGWVQGPSSPDDAWEGMPEFNPEKRSYRSITVHLQDEAALRDFEERMGQMLPEGARYLWHPFKPKEKAKHTWVEAPPPAADAEG
jgi:hypothetical protein